MTFKDDIIQRIENDFGQQANLATDILVDAINKVDYLQSDRVIRCILFLAKGDLTDLNKYITSATYDQRDVMLWAEYEKLSTIEDYKRLRNFNNTFDNCTIYVQE